MQGLLLAGRYRLVESIGSGGMGRVWRAHDEVLHRAVAIKELTAALYVTESDRAVLLARTHAEARAAARINHSAVVTVHDVLDHDNRPWIVMELVEGNSLADEVKEKGRVEPTDAARIGLWVLRALRAAHSAGVLHRDVKPGNVLLSSDRRVLLTDFGIAQVEGDTTITRTGEIVGSVDYLAPERVRGHDPGPSADLWALGATLYTAVEGRSPFRRTSPLTTMQAVVDEEPAPPQYAGPLGPVITALLNKDPAVRPGAEEAEQMLAEAAEGRRPSAAQAYVPTRQHVDTGTLGMGAQRVAPYGTAPHGTGSHGAAPHGPGAHETASHGSVAHGSGAHGATPTLHAPVPGPLGDGTGSGGASGRRRRGRTIALVVVLAALIGGGGAVAMHYVNGARTGDTHNSASSGSANSGTTKPGSTPTATSGTQEPSGAVPDTWVQRDDVEGFTISLPDKTWQRQANGNQVDYTPDGGKHFVRIAIDDSPDFPTPFAHQQDLEQQLTKLVDYHQVLLQSNTFRDCPGSLWDFTWTALPKQTPFPGERRAIEQTYLSREGVEYAIYMSSPAADWDTARRQFDMILRSWLPKT
ncbi:serine/threonine protein kinase [Streptomyces sp. Ag82_O1-15]|jgi:tRNA A-37 threonylcarbamoyl transferase component Bud32|uniref:serine/threonine-protein kinase n=1 Tax=Streptomyces sp. Ag82_O1-15 TaxID=1938855 RepID=UPI000BB156A5|nr:serine/threonine-protein kinase [Streptomyces sp. Ag82_O1-15]PBC96812.1 serine/threonine protein kinase [Streptomyces sp. Ag82_O1-15]